MLLDAILIAVVENMAVNPTKIIQGTFRKVTYGRCDVFISIFNSAGKYHNRKNKVLRSQGQKIERS
jgi:hypothetical protein